MAWILLVCYQTCAVIPMATEAACIEAQDKLAAQQVAAHCVNRDTGDVLSAYI